MDSSCWKPGYRHALGQEDNSVAGLATRDESTPSRPEAAREDDHLLGLFRGWQNSERLFVTAPLALWVLVFSVWAVVLMVRQRRAMFAPTIARQLRGWWGITFLAAAAWLVGWSIWLTAEGSDGHRRLPPPQEQAQSP